MNIYICLYLLMNTEIKICISRPQQSLLCPNTVSNLP